MSLVAYGSSDESENEEDSNEEPQAELIVEKIDQNLNKKSKLQLPTPKTEQVNAVNSDNVDNIDENKLNFDLIPKPKLNTVPTSDIKEEIGIVTLTNKVNYGNIEKPPKKEKGPIRITIPSLTDFQEEETEPNHKKRQPSQKKSGLIGILPPPKTSLVTTKSSLMVPNILTKKPSEVKKLIQPNTTILSNTKKIESSTIKKHPVTATITSLSNYKSDSEEEDDKESSGLDFFALSKKVTTEDLPSLSKEEIYAIEASALNKSNDTKKIEMKIEENSLNEEKTNKVLTSNVINLPKEEILLKNKTEVGPKLPIPEQEYNVDQEGNVAFDEKAIEYLCGKRGVKRKSEFNNIDIIEINGEDIKPDEREWMIKALTDESAQKPISIGSGPGGQSKKKHQITYLAHQAKAMELELKNQWAQNKATRQQTRSKYGF